MSPRVAVLGLGAMGLPMATHLARDHEVIAFDVNPERLSLAELAGARPAESPAQIMVGAGPAALARGRSVLEALASTLTVAGPRVGDGQMLKTVNQLLCGVHTAAAAEALALAHALGLDLDSTLEVLGKGAAASFMLSDRGPRIAQQLTGSRPELRSRLDVISKDMGIVARLAREVKVATPVAGAAGQLFLLGEALGFSAEDDSVIAIALHASSPESPS